MGMHGPARDFYRKNGENRPSESHFKVVRKAEILEYGCMWGRNLRSAPYIWHACACEKLPLISHDSFRQMTGESICSLIVHTQHAKYRLRPLLFPIYVIRFAPNLAAGHVFPYRP